MVALGRVRAMMSTRWFVVVLVPLLALLAVEVLWQISTAWTEAAQKQAEDAPVVYRGARIHTASGPVIERGVLIVLKGKILDVGAEDKVKIPANAKVRDMTGKV